MGAAHAARLAPAARSWRRMHGAPSMSVSVFPWAPARRRRPRTGQRCHRCECFRSSVQLYCLPCGLGSHSHTALIILSGMNGLWSSTTSIMASVARGATWSFWATTSGAPMVTITKRSITGHGSPLSHGCSRKGMTTRPATRSSGSGMGALLKHPLAC